MAVRTLLACLCTLLLAACAGTQYVTGDSRENFDTAKGMYGGNEFGPRSIEGKETYANDPHAPATAAAPASAPASAPPAATAPATPAAAPPAPVLASAATATAAPAAAPAALAIDANAYAAVFGATPGPVRPSAEQLLRLDSLALVAAESTRVDLQTKILACRRAGDACRIAHP
jgi:hypothetical protein